MNYLNKPDAMTLRTEGNVLFVTFKFKHDALHLKGPRAGFTTPNWNAGTVVHYNCTFDGFYPCNEDGSEIVLSKTELMEMEGSPPAIMPDGKAALLIRWPGYGSDECGFQVPGEEDIRWHSLRDVIPMPGGGLLVVNRVGG